MARQMDLYIGLVACLRFGVSIMTVDVDSCTRFQ